MHTIILASQSPRRKQLLEWAEIPFRILVKETDESYPAGLSMQDTAIHIARGKALAVSGLAGGAVIVAADTIVVLDNIIIGKPKDRDHAIAILTSLAGRRHEVVTGVVIRRAGASSPQEIAFADTTTVFFHPLTHEQIEHYVDQYKPFDKAGAYAIQEWIGVVGIRSVEGDFYNVMGLPVSRVVRALEEFESRSVCDFTDRE